MVRELDCCWHSFLYSIARALACRSICSLAYMHWHLRDCLGHRFCEFHYSRRSGGPRSSDCGALCTRITFTYWTGIDYGATIPSCLHGSRGSLCKYSLPERRETGTQYPKVRPLQTNDVKNEKPELEILSTEISTSEPVEGGVKGE